MTRVYQILYSLKREIFMVRPCTMALFYPIVDPKKPSITRELRVELFILVRKNSNISPVIKMFYVLLGKAIKKLPSKMC